MGLEVIMSVAGLAFQAFSASQQASQQKKWNEYNAKVAENNAFTARQMAADIVERGKLQRQEHERKVRSLLGKQTATLAGNGIQLSGSAFNLLSDTELFGLIDANTITNNAKREAWKMEVQARNDEAQAGGYQFAADSINPTMAGMTTLAAGAGSVASKWLDSSGGFSSGGGSDAWGYGGGYSGVGVDLGVGTTNKIPNGTIDWSSTPKNWVTR